MERVSSADFWLSAFFGRRTLPLSALFFAVVLLGESLGFLQLVGAVLILGGAAFGELLHQKQFLEVTKDSLVS